MSDMTPGPDGPPTHQGAWWVYTGDKPRRPGMDVPESAEETGVALDEDAVEEPGVVPDGELADETGVVPGEGPPADSGERLWGEPGERLADETGVVPGEGPPADSGEGHWAKPGGWAAAGEDITQAAPDEPAVYDATAAVPADDDVRGPGAAADDRGRPAPGTPGGRDGGVPAGGADGPRAPSGEMPLGYGGPSTGDAGLTEPTVSAGVPYPRREESAATTPERTGAQGEPGEDAGTRDEPEEPSLRAGLEAILLVVDEPVPVVTLAQILERPRDEVTAALRDLAAEYTGQSRGFDLREVAGGWRFYTRDVCAPLVERFVRDGQQARLTQAALETLAVVAYRQPVSRARVSAIRGVNSDGVIRTLTMRGLIEEAGQDPEHQALLYRTTSYFLERLGLNSLDELPDLAPYLPDDLEGIEEQQL